MNELPQELRDKPIRSMNPGELSEWGRWELQRRSIEESLCFRELIEELTMLNERWVVGWPLFTIPVKDVWEHITYEYAESRVCYHYEPGSADFITVIDKHSPNHDFLRMSFIRLKDIGWEE